MPFTSKPGGWQNGQAGGTPLNAVGLNDLETRIGAAVTTVDTSLAVVKEAPLNIAYPEFGAAINGSTDDTAAWSAAFAALPAYTGGAGGGAILHPGGISQVSSTLEIPHDGVTIIGPAGRQASVIRGNIAGPILTTDVVGTNYVRLENLFVLNQSSNAAARSIEFDTLNVLDLVGCAFQATGTYAARLRHCFNVTGERNNFGGAAGPDAALFLDNSGGVENTAVRLFGNSFRATKAGLIGITVRGFSISGNHFEGLAGSATLYQGAVGGSGWIGGEITGNYFESNPMPALELLQNIGFNRGLTVGGNFITNPGSHGINAANIERSVFLPNYVWPGANAVNANAINTSSTSLENIYHPQYLVSGTGATIIQSTTDKGVILEKSRVQARNSVIALTKAGVPSDSDFTVTPPNGTFAVDETNNRIYVRIAGTWKSATVA